MGIPLLSKGSRSGEQDRGTSPTRPPNELEITGLRAVSQATIYPHVFANADREVGGVLVGRMPADGGLPMVTGAIPAVSADERRATLTFTQDAWAHVHRVLDSEFPPDEQIVGWYHSHPGFGIFLSGHDLFIHENFFSSPSQIAVVVDPHARTEGAFVWRQQSLFTLFDRPTPDGRVASPAHGFPSPARGLVTPALVHEEPQRPLLALVVAGVIGVLLGLGAWTLLFEGAGSGTPKPVRSAITTKPHVTVRRHIATDGSQAQRSEFESEEER